MSEANVEIGDAAAAAAAAAAAPKKRRTGQDALRELIRRKIQLPLGIIRAFHEKAADRAKMSPESRRRTMAEMQERFKEAMHNKRRPSNINEQQQQQQRRPSNMNEQPFNLVVDLADGSSFQDLSPGAASPATPKVLPPSPSQPKQSLPVNLQPYINDALEVAGETMGRSPNLRKISLVKAVRDFVLFSLLVKNG